MSQILSIDPGMYSGYALLEPEKVQGKSTLQLRQIGVIFPNDKIKGRFARLEHQRNAIDVTVNQICTTAGDFDIVIEQPWLNVQGAKLAGNPYDILAVGEIVGYWLMATARYTDSIYRISPRTWQSYFEKPSRISSKEWAGNHLERMLTTGIISLSGLELKPYAEHKIDAILVGLYKWLVEGMECE